MTDEVLDPALSSLLDNVLAREESRFSLHGKVAVVTGASYGLGQLFAETLAGLDTAALVELADTTP